MSISDRAIAASKPAEMPEHERPISEQFRIIGKKWADAESAASIREKTKKDVLEKIKERIVGTSDMPDNKAERLARCTSEWREFKVAMITDRNVARLLKIQLEWIEMRHQEWISANANARQERRL